ncbi:UNVERIFIED_CONTAM: hypothetical protein K2H54_023710 [Gekko kuhli]
MSKGNGDILTSTGDGTAPKPKTMAPREETNLESICQGETDELRCEMHNMTHNLPGVIMDVIQQEFQNWD